MEYLNEKSPIITFNHESLILKHHQLSSIYKMREIESTIKFPGVNNISFKTGVLGLEVGAGKSYIILAHVFTLKCILGPSTEHYGYYNNLNIDNVISRYTIQKRINYLSISVLIVPHNIYSQWEEYLTLFDLTKIYKIGGMRQINRLTKDFKLLDNITLIVVKNTFLYDFQSIILNKNIKFARIIIDEADLFYNVNIELDAYFTWYVSATFLNEMPFSYYALRNQTNIIRARLLYEKTGFESIIVANHNYISFNQTYDPIINYYNYSQQFKMIISETNLISAEIANMINVGAYNELAYKLGFTVTKSSNIIDGILHVIVNKINKIKENINEISDQYYKTQNDLLKLSTNEQNLIKYNNQLESIKNRIKENICIICLEYAENNIISLCCNQIYCSNCLIHLLKHNTTICSMCRESLIQTFKKYENIHLTQIETIRNLIFELLTDIKSRILICGDFDSTFNILLNNINKWSMIKGSSKMISKILKQFESGEKQILCLNSKYSCAGMNITCATDIIMFNNLSEATKTQFIGRAQRPGRKTPLNIHYLRTVE